MKIIYLLKEKLKKNEENIINVSNFFSKLMITLIFYVCLAVIPFTHSACQPSAGVLLPVLPRNYRFIFYGLPFPFY